MDTIPDSNAKTSRKDLSKLTHPQKAKNLFIIIGYQNYHVPPELSEYFYKSGALENMKMELRI